MNSDQTMRGRYRYQAAIKVTIAADSQDEAYRVQQAIVRELGATHSQGGKVVSITASMLDLRHRPDLDGSLRSASDQKDGGS